VLVPTGILSVGGATVPANESNQVVIVEMLLFVAVRSMLYVQLPVASTPVLVTDFNFKLSESQALWVPPQGGNFMQTLSQTRNSPLTKNPYRIHIAVSEGGVSVNVIVCVLEPDGIVREGGAIVPCNEVNPTITAAKDEFVTERSMLYVQFPLASTPVLWIDFTCIESESHGFPLEHGGKSKQILSQRIL